MSSRRREINSENSAPGDHHQISYSHQMSIGVQRQFLSDFAIEANLRRHRRTCAQSLRRRPIHRADTRFQKRFSLGGQLGFRLSF